MCLPGFCKITGARTGTRTGVLYQPDESPPLLLVISPDLQFAGGLLRNGMNAGGFLIILMTLILELIKTRGK